MRDLPREQQPSRALEERVVSTLVAAGLVRRRRAWPVWAATAAAALVVAIGVWVARPARPAAPRNTYVLLLHEDSAYRPPLEGQGAERLAEMRRWADSLDALGTLERAGRLVGPGPIDGLFMVRAADDSAAARIAATCPFHKWGGRVEVKRFED